LSNSHKRRAGRHRWVHRQLVFWSISSRDPPDRRRGDRRCRLGVDRWVDCDGKCAA